MDIQDHRTNTKTKIMQRNGNTAKTPERSFVSSSLTVIKEKINCNVLLEEHLREKITMINK